MNILLVDDDPDQLSLLSSAVSFHTNGKVFGAKDGLRALEVLESEQIDVVVTDYNMPIMDGAELVKAIKAKYEKSRILIIGVSGCGASASAKFIGAGANQFLAKPFKTSELLETIRRYCSKLSLDL